MHNPMMITAPVLTNATKPMKTISDYIRIHDTVSCAADDCAAHFFNQYPARDLDEIAHVSFDPRARTIEFQLG